jgi:signal transduction histidine kinase
MSLFKKKHIPTNALTLILGALLIIVLLSIIITIVGVLSLSYEKINQPEWLLIIVSTLSLLISVLTVAIIKFGLMPLLSKPVQAPIGRQDTNESASPDILLKNAFLSNMSHELRTPLNAILGYSEMLIDEADEIDTKECLSELKKINRAGMHLLALINDVLELSLIDSGKIDINTVEFSIENFIGEMQTNIQSLMTENNNKFSVIFSTKLTHLPAVFQDKDKLYHALLNLLSNAAKFTHDDEVVLYVDCHNSKERDWLVLTVSDNGIGIAQDKLSLIIKPFTQVDNSSSRHYDGTGLGLAITQKLCQLLGGELSIHSEIGKGSDFTIKIPFYYCKK